jgi:hypothetical protein
MRTLTRLTCAFALLAIAVSAADKDGAGHTTTTFQGNAVNGGTAIHFRQDGKSLLRVSDDFKVPNTPAPTWRVIDSKGVIYTLDAFKIKGGEKRQVVVPAYVPNIAKVQVYCAWAEAVLGEASFSSPVN